MTLPGRNHEVFRQTTASMVLAMRTNSHAQQDFLGSGSLGRSRSGVCVECDTRGMFRTPLPSAHA
jgi:hypothetical protein